MAFGKHDISHAHNLSGHGNAIIPLFFATPSAIIAAARGASIKNGIGQVFLSVILERTKPGQTTETLIFLSRKCNLNASPQALTNALLALYDGQVANP